MSFSRPRTLLPEVIAAAMAAETAPISQSIKKGTGEFDPEILAKSLHKSANKVKIFVYCVS